MSRENLASRPIGDIVPSEAADRLPWGVRTPRKAASVLPSKHSSTPTVGEVLAHVQGESLKANTALLARLLNSPVTRTGERDGS